jgi:hypothetical protein
MVVCDRSKQWLWQGVLWVKNGKSQKACEYFEKARQFALTIDEVSGKNM